MSFKITYHTVGGTMLEFEAVDEKDVVQQISFWQSLPEECPECQAPVRFFHRNPQGNSYYGLICAGKDPHETNFGQYRKGGLYFKGNWQKAGSQFNNDREDEIHNSDAPASSSPSRSAATAATTPAQDFPAEHARLDKLIAEEWAKKTRAQSYESLVRERYGVTTDKLTINHKKEILTKLQEKNGAKEAVKA